MIYYFSGTGNSLHVARHLADALGERLCSILASPVLHPALTGGGNGEAAERVPPRGDLEGVIGLVFPVYAWGIPNVVEKFVRNYKASLLGGRLEGGFLYAVMTCGDDMGYADKVLESVLGRKLDAAFSVLMPDVYVCLPGFDVDSAEECKEKYAKEEVQVKEIAACISERKKVRQLKRGPFPFTKSYIIRPLFNRYLVTDKYFNVDASKCISCGRCRKSCPVGNIIVDEVPQWQSHCTGCLACYHACPYHAINFGKMTQKKGQYNLLKQLNS